MEEGEGRLASRALIRLRRICLALPEAHEALAWGEPTFRIRNRLFAMYADAGNHHGKGRDAVWFKAAPGDQLLLVTGAPETFFVPAYVGPSGWVGMWLDGNADWARVTEIASGAYRLVAPKSLVRVLDETPARPRPARTAGSAPAAPDKRRGHK
jgi:predicted DNA-binding protein (MmcQ/YjbR family)